MNDHSECGKIVDTANALSRFPRTNLLDAYTPLHDFLRLTVDVGGAAIAGKPNDALTLAFGGNKMRKLECYLGDALAKGVDTVLITSVL